MQSLQLVFSWFKLSDAAKKITSTEDTHKFEILKLGFAMFAMVDSMIKNQQNLSGESIQNQKSQ